MRVSSLTTILLFSLLSCKTVSHKNSELSMAAPTSGTTTLSLTSLNTVDDFQTFSKEASSLAQAKRTMKFLIDMRKATPQIHFINANFSGRCRVENDCNKYHYNFAREGLGIRDSLDSFNKITYFDEKKVYIAGSINTYVYREKLIYGIQLYPQDSAKEETIVAISKTVAAGLKIPGAEIAFVSTGNQQTVGTVKDKLSGMNVQTLTLEMILGSTNFIPMHQGDAWGYLRIFPKNEADLIASDIPVFDELPLDLTVVAGTMTRAYQDSNSHINLKSKERNTPNMVLRDAGPNHPQLAALADKPVHLKITAQGWTIEASTDAIVQKKVAEKMNRPWVAINWKSASEPQSFAEMCKGKAANCLGLGAFFGSKASNLGFLKELFTDRSIPQLPPLTYDPVPMGFGIPLQFYKDLVDYPSNAALKAKMLDLIEKEKAGRFTVSDRNAAAAELRQMFLNAEVPPQNLAKVVAMAGKVNAKYTKWKIRSSANAEDIENFDGAGLHDSYTGKLTTKDNAEHTCVLEEDAEDGAGELVKMKVNPKTFSCAMKGVYASLWNKRAIEERSFARIDHSSVAMGLAVVPNYDTESPVAANGVVVTRVINAPDILGYSLSLQKDNNTVTNPTPGTWSEVVIAAMGATNEGEPSFTTMRFAKPAADAPALTESVMTKDKVLLLTNLVRKVEEFYCRSKPNYYEAGDCRDVALDSGKHKSLDLEVKYLQNGEFVVKQVREFGGK